MWPEKICELWDHHISQALDRGRAFAVPIIRGAKTLTTNFAETNWSYSLPTQQINSGCVFIQDLQVKLRPVFLTMHAKSRVQYESISWDFQDPCTCCSNVSRHEYEKEFITWLFPTISTGSDKGIVLLRVIMIGLWLWQQAWRLCVQVVRYVMCVHIWPCPQNFAEHFGHHNAHPTFQLWLYQEDSASCLPLHMCQVPLKHEEIQCE